MGVSITRLQVDGQISLKCKLFGELNFFPPVLIMTSQCCPLFASFGIAMTCMDESDLRVENQFTVVLASMYASLAL